MRVVIKLNRSLLASSVWAVAIASVLGASLSGSAEPLDVWTTRWTSSVGIQVNGIAYRNGSFVATSPNNGGSLLTSSDGLAWTQYTTPLALNYSGIISAGGSFFTFGLPINNSSTNFILSSPDGLNWTKIYETSGSVRAAAYGNGRLLFAGPQRIIMVSLNSSNWTETQPNLSFSSIAYGMGRFVAVTYSQSSISSILSSSDGVVWRYDYAAYNLSFGGIAYGNGQFVASWQTNRTGDYTSGVLVSSNLSEWTTIPLANLAITPPIGPVAFGGEQFIAAIKNLTYTSADGLVWTNRSGISSALAFSYASGTFLAGAGSSIRQSDVFATQTSPPPSTVSIATYPGLTVTGTEGLAYRIEYTTDLRSNSLWLPLTNLTLPYSPYLWVDTSSPTIARRFYRAVQIE